MSTQHPIITTIMNGKMVPREHEFVYAKHGTWHP